MYCILTVAQYNSTENFVICLIPLIIGVVYSVLHCCTCGKYNRELKEQLI